MPRICRAGPRGHRGVENGLHRTLDMPFQEDNCRLRRLTLNKGWIWHGQTMTAQLSSSSKSNDVKPRDCGAGSHEQIV